MNFIKFCSVASGVQRPKVQLVFVLLEARTEFVCVFFVIVVCCCSLSVKIISLILIRVNHKVGRKRDISEKKHMTIRKQNLACLTCDPSKARTHGGEMTSDLDSLNLGSLTTRPRGPPRTELLPFVSKHNLIATTYP